MGYNSTTERLISLKKLAGKAQTSNLKGLSNEGLPSGVTISFETVFGENITKEPSDTALYTITGQVEYLRFPTEFIAGTATADGRHGFELRLPDNYNNDSSNPNAGTYPYQSGQIVNITSGALQMVPPSFAADYEAKPYYGGGAVVKDDGTRIYLLDERDWYLDYFNGVFFQQTPPGTGADPENPDYVEGYLYIGDYLDTAPSGGGINEVIAGVGLSGGGTGSTVTLDVDTAIVAGRRTKDTYFIASVEPALTTIPVVTSDFSTASYEPSLIDILLNGQLLHSGSSVQVADGDRDYYISSATSLKFAFSLHINDIIDVVVFKIVT